MSKVVLFNGPSKCGKDTAAIFCAQAYLAVQGKMADPLKDAICAFFSLTREQLENLKDQVCPYSPDGLTWRQVLIDFSEKWAKPLFGQEIHGAVSLARHRAPHFLITVSDSGFDYEALPWIRHYGPENILLVRIRRPGFNFKGDSRSYISLAEYGVQEVDIENDGELWEFQNRVLSTVSQFINTKEEHAA